MSDVRRLIKLLQAENKQLNSDNELLKKTAAFFAKNLLVKYAFIRQEKKAYPVTQLCRVLGVCRSGFYEWEQTCQRKQARSVEQSCLVVDMKEIFESSKVPYGARRMARALCALGYAIGRHKAATLMKRAWVRSA